MAVVERVSIRRGADRLRGRHPVAVAGRPVGGRARDHRARRRCSSWWPATPPARSAPRGCAPAGPRSTSSGSALELARVGEVAGLFRRGRRAAGGAGARRLDARWPDSGSRAASWRARDLVAILRVLERRPPGPRRPPPGGGGRAARRRALPSARRQGRSSAGWSSRSTPTGACSTRASPALAAARREVQQARQRLLRRLDSLLRGLDADVAAADACGHGARRPLRHPGAPRLAEPARRHRARRVGQRRDALRRADRGDRAGQRAARGGGGGGAGDAAGAPRAERDAAAGAAGAPGCGRDVRRGRRPRRPGALRGRGGGRGAGGDRRRRPDSGSCTAAIRCCSPARSRWCRSTWRWRPSERTLLISGPNTGGKTVLLKAVGLASALAQSGIVPPVGAGTRLPALRRLLRRHRRPPVDLRQSLHLQRPRRDAAPRSWPTPTPARWCCWTRWAAAPIPRRARRSRRRSSRRSPRAAPSPSPPPTSARSRISRATRPAW